MTNSLPSGTVTLLFTDIEDSSGKWEEHRSEMAAALTQHNRLLIEAISGNGGVVVKDKGDGFFAAFPSADAALSCALDAQLSLRAADWPDAIGTLKVRMALHTGTVRNENGDYHGPVVNRVARLEGIAHGGQVLVSEATKTLVEDSLPEGASLVDLGTHALRGMERAERVFQLMAPDLADEFPPLLSAVGGIALPSYPTSFVGRSTELQAIGELLDGEGRLVTLLGPGGIGKTRLAVETARDMANGLAGGAFFVDLARFSEADDVGFAIAEAVGAHPEGTASNVTLAAARITRPTLLVLDNFEHLASAATTVAELLELATDVRVIATSRTPLHIRGERIFPIEPLSSQNGSGSVPAAVELFYERAAGFGVSLGDEGSDAEAVRSIVRRLDGLPLAIELVAARTRLIGIGELDAMLARSLDAVGSGAADLPVRQRTIRSTIDWSLKALTEGQRNLFSQLSIFPAGATLAQLEDVSGPDIGGDLLHELAALVDNSLVNVVTDQPGGTRYRQLALLRDYGAELLSQSGSTDLIMGRLVDYYVATVPEQGRRIQTSDTVEKEIRADHDSLVAAMNWSLDHDRAADMVDGVCDIWVYWFNGDRAMSAAQWVAIADEQLDTPKLDWLVGFFAFQTGDFEKAVARFMGAIERFEETEDAEWKAMSQGFAGALFEDLDAGREMLEAAVSQFGEHDFGV
ncbi:MAG: adenylate/guanylate cyclase domain-containing protein, partial [Acidimicrobiia bacterium]